MDKVLGFDLGTKTLGIAKSDAMGIAHGYEEFRFLEGAYRQALRHAIEVIDKEGIKEIALGYPLNMDGSVGERAKSSEMFRLSLLKERPDLKIELVDERLSTVMASKRLLEADLSRGKRHKVIDKAAATVILESYLMRKEALAAIEEEGEDDGD